MVERMLLVELGFSRSGSGITFRESGLPGPGYKRVRFRRKTPVNEVFRGSSGNQSRPRVWKRLKLGVSLVLEDDHAGGRQLHDHLDFLGPVHDRTAIG